MESISILGCGWFGLPLAKALIKSGYQVKGSTTSTEKLLTLEKNNIKPYLISSKSLQSANKEFFESDILIISIPPRKTTHAEFLQQMLGIKNLVELSTIKKIIFISSTSVYPELNREVKEYDADFIPAQRSGIKLLEIENIWMKMEKAKTIVMRFGGLFGPGRNPGKFLAGKTTTGKDNPVNMIHLDDCIGITKALLKNDEWDNVYNVCSEIHPTREEFYTKASSISSMEAPKFEPPHLGSFKIINSDRLLEDIEYRFLYNNPLDGLSA